MKKMFCIDIDGTLLRTNGTVSNHTVDVIKRLKEDENEVVLCSARSRQSTIDICKLIGASDYVISSNGAEIYNHYNKDVVNINAVNKDMCISLWNTCNDNNFKISYAIGDFEYVNTPFWNGQIILNDINEINNKLVKSIMIVFDDYDKGLELFNSIKTNDAVKSCCSKIQKDECGFWFNILDKKTSKGFAIKELAKLLNVSKENIISFGNDYSDISMFKTSGEGCAVSNADQKLKNIAHKIILSNDEDGVANYILNNYLDM